MFQHETSPATLYMWPLIFYNVKYIPLSPPPSAPPAAHPVLMQIWSDGEISPQKALNLVLLCAMADTWRKGRLILDVCIQRENTSPHKPAWLRCCAPAETTPLPAELCLGAHRAVLMKPQAESLLFCHIKRFTSNKTEGLGMEVQHLLRQSLVSLLVFWVF